MSPMRNVYPIISAAGICILLSMYTAAVTKRDKENREHVNTGNAVLWESVPNIADRDLYYGPGGKEGAPCEPYTFIAEDLEGTTPKFDVRDGNGVKWRVKLGLEARPETAASRLIWSIGYFTNEDFYLSSLQVNNLPARLHRGQKYIGSDGTVTNARLKRHPDYMKKIGIWHWKENPFLNTREFNGLRVMMALINNWDLKDINNAIYRREEPNDADISKNVYIVSDLGASFGSGRWSRSLNNAKGNLKYYRKSNFISKDEINSLDFDLGGRPALNHAIVLPLYSRYLGMDWIGKNIPRSDAKWLGQLLAQLSPGQIRNAFRAAGYSQVEIDGFTQVILARISELNNL